MSLRPEQRKDPADRREKEAPELDELRGFFSCRGTDIRLVGWTTYVY